MAPKPKGTTTYKNVGVHAQSIDGGAVLDLGEEVDLDADGAKANQVYIDSGHLADVSTLSPSEEAVVEETTTGGEEA